MIVRKIVFICLLLLPTAVIAQSDQHYTMFMYNKIMYNPAYTGSRDATSVNALYRDQWDGINGAPKTINLSVDGLVGSYMKPVRKYGVGLSITNEKLGVESNSVIKAYYAYRIFLSQSVLSLGLSGGINLYSAAYSKLNLYQQNDPNFASNLRNAMLPNFGAGAYWSGDNYYAGLSVPNLLEDYYDKHEVKLNNKLARQIRAYYLGGGYVYAVNEIMKLEPQLLARYAINGDYKLPFNCDINVSAIAYDRLLVGFTYRTDNSFEVILHVQATKKLNIGYAYDYLLSALNGYNGGSHELVVGWDFVKDNSKYQTPRFIRKF